MTRAWCRLDSAALKELPVNTGVFALRPVVGGPLEIRLAGARSRQGLRGELELALGASAGTELEFTYVSTSNYLTLFRERTDFPDRFDPEFPFVRRDGHTPAQRFRHDERLDETA